MSDMEEQVQQIRTVMRKHGFDKEAEALVGDKIVPKLIEMGAAMAVITSAAAFAKLMGDKETEKPEVVTRWLKVGKELGQLGIVTNITMDIPNQPGRGALPTARVTRAPAMV